MKLWNNRKKENITISRKKLIECEKMGSLSPALLPVISFGKSVTIFQTAPINQNSMFCLKILNYNRGKETIKKETLLIKMILAFPSKKWNVPEEFQLEKSFIFDWLQSVARLKVWGKSFLGQDFWINRLYKYNMKNKKYFVFHSM